MIIWEWSCRGEGRKVECGQDWMQPISVWKDHTEKRQKCSLLMITTSWVASTYRARPSNGNVVGLLSSVEFVVELYYENAQPSTEPKKGTPWDDRHIQFGLGFWSTSPLILERTQYLGHVRRESRMSRHTRSSSRTYAENGLSRPALFGVEVKTNCSRIIELVPVLFRKQGAEAGIAQRDGLSSERAGKGMNP